MNQPNAGYANYAVLVESLLPIIDVNGGDVDEIRDQMLKKAQSVFSDTVDRAMRSKMGLEGGPTEMTEEADDLWGEIEPLLRMARGDWTIFWRQLTYVAAQYSLAKDGDYDDPSDYDDMVTMLLGEGNTNPFYDPLTDENRATLRAWIEKWHKALTKCYKYASESSTEDCVPPEEPHPFRCCPFLRGFPNTPWQSDAQSLRVGRPTPESEPRTDRAVLNNHSALPMATLEYTSL